MKLSEEYNHNNNHTLDNDDDEYDAGLNSFVIQYF